MFFVVCLENVHYFILRFVLCYNLCPWFTFPWRIMYNSVSNSVGYGILKERVACFELRYSWFKEALKCKGKKPRKIPFSLLLIMLALRRRPLNNNRIGFEKLLSPPHLPPPFLYNNRKWNLKRLFMIHVSNSLPFSFVTKVSSSFQI